MRQRLVVLAVRGATRALAAVTRALLRRRTRRLMKRLRALPARYSALGQEAERLLAHSAALDAAAARLVVKGRDLLACLDAHPDLAGELAAAAREAQGGITGAVISTQVAAILQRPVVAPEAPARAGRRKGRR